MYIFIFYKDIYHYNIIINLFYLVLKFYVLYIKFKKLKNNNLILCFEREIYNKLIYINYIVNDKINITLFEILKRIS